MIGDLCRALEREVLPYCDVIMLQLMKNLQDPQCDRSVVLWSPQYQYLAHSLVLCGYACRSVKPPILSALGDIALAIKPDFQRFLDQSMAILHSTGCGQLEIEDQDDKDYRNKLHENIIEGYSSIVQALHHCQRAQLLERFLPNICTFFEDKIVRCTDRDSEVTKCAINLVGDLAQAMKQSLGGYIQNQWVQELFDSAAVADCLDDAQWARSQITQYDIVSSPSRAATAPLSGGLFGGSTASSGGLFGGSTTPASSGGANTAPLPSSSGGMFGEPSTAP